MVSFSDQIPGGLRAAWNFRVYKCRSVFKKHNTTGMSVRFETNPNPNSSRFSTLTWSNTSRGGGLGALAATSSIRCITRRRNDRRDVWLGASGFKAPVNIRVTRPNLGSPAAIRQAWRPETRGYHITCEARNACHHKLSQKLLEFHKAFF